MGSCAAKHARFGSPDATAEAVGWKLGASRRESIPNGERASSTALAQTERVSAGSAQPIHDVRAGLQRRHPPLLGVR